MLDWGFLGCFLDTSAHVSFRHCLPCLLLLYLQPLPMSLHLFMSLIFLLETSDVLRFPFLLWALLLFCLLLLRFIFLFINEYLHIINITYNCHTILLLDLGFCNGNLNEFLFCYCFIFSSFIEV